MPTPRTALRTSLRTTVSLACGLVLAHMLGAADARAQPGPVDAPTLLGRAYAAYDRGDLDEAHAVLARLAPVESALTNRDYALWIRGQVELTDGDPAAALAAFTALGKIAGSRFLQQVSWRLADCEWTLGHHAQAVTAYEKLLAQPDAGTRAEVGAIRFRIAEHRAAGSGAKAERAGADAYHAFLVDYPTHPLAAEAERRLVALAGEGAIRWSTRERLERAKHLSTSHLWHEAIAELALIPDDVSPALRDQRDYWMGSTLYDMRRRYGDAGELLLSVYPRMGGNAAEAMFHGARALSRADRDDEAITWYRKVVAAYPSTDYAAEAQYLSGWLEFNRGHYQEAVAPLQETLRRYGSSKFAVDALWFLGMTHYLLGDWSEAQARLEELSRRGKSLEGGKGQYWLARIHQRAGRADAAIAGFRTIVGRWPFSWYALLARARLTEAGVTVGPFGDRTPTPRGAAIATTVDESLASDRLIARVDELLAAGLGVEAGDELERGERGFLGRHDRAAGFAIVLDRYRKAGNFNRPWMLAVVYGSSALSGPAEGPARVWWEHAYPRGYRELIEKYQAVGANPEGYLYSIMRKESGFDPHVLSYADAQGLLQMIPATTIRVAQSLGIPYDPGRLYEPDFNVQTGAWYIGNLLTKFKGQIPLGAGSFNSGPRPVMKWLDQNGTRPIDELVELVSYTQTREYMKKVTENYARYTYLYGGAVYEQPLVVDQAYIVDKLTY